LLGTPEGLDSLRLWQSLREKDGSERNTDGKMDRPSLIAEFFRKNFGSSQTYMQTAVTTYNYYRYANKIKEKLDI